MMLQICGHHGVNSKYLEFGKKILPSQFREIFHQDLEVIVEYLIYKHHVVRSHAIYKGKMKWRFGCLDNLG